MPHHEDDDFDFAPEARQRTATQPAIEAPEPILRYFEYEHLPPHLREVSSLFFRLAHAIVENCPRNPERSVALRKLLESKDATVRSRL